MRLFFAAIPAPEMRGRIEAAAAGLRLPEDARRVPIENYHLTIAFAGEVTREQAVALRAIGAAVRHPPFELCLDAYDYWPTAGVVVATARECPPTLSALHRALRAGFVDFAPPAEPGAFRPHVTLARKITQAPVLKAMSELPWTIRDFQLVCSSRPPQGSVYTVVDSWPLLDSAGRGP